MNALNESILNDAALYFHELDRSSEKNLKKDQWIRSGTVPMFYPSFENTRNKILYVGMNPSITPDMVKLFKSVYHEEKFLDLIYLLSLDEQEKKVLIQKLIDFQAALKGKNPKLEGIKRYSYFTAISNLHNHVFENSEIGWEHYDIIPYRSTHQQHITKMFYNKSRRKSELLDQFFISCINNFIKLVEHCGFRGVVVCNAQVSKYLKDHQVLGLNKYQYGSTGNILLSKQLTGGGLKKMERKELIKSMGQIFR